MTDVNSKVERIVSTEFGVSSHGIHDKEKKRENIDARHFIWYVLRSLYNVPAKSIASEYSTTPRNVFHGCANVSNGIRAGHPFYCVHYRNIRTALEDEGMGWKQFYPIRQRTVFTPLREDARVIRDQDRFILTLSSRTIDRDGSVICGTGVSLNITMGYMAIIFPLNVINPNEVDLKNPPIILDCHTVGEVRVRFPANSADYLRGYEKGSPIGVLSLMKIPKV